MAPGSVRNQRSCIFIARHSTNDHQRTSQVSLGGRFVMRSLARCSEVLLLDVVENESEVLSLLTVVSDGDRRGALDLAGVALLVIVAVTEPLTEIHPRVDLIRGMLEDFVMALTNFLYFASSQSEASTAIRACLRSRALRTSLRPFTSPIRMEYQLFNNAISPRADHGACLTQEASTGTYRH